MGSIAKIPFGSNGLPILQADDSSPGTAIFTTTSTSGVIDEVYLYITNITSGALQAVLRYDNGDDDPVQETITIPAYTKYLAIPGVPMNGVAIYVYCADDVNELVVSGFANRITP
jgi:hypothetical protein